MWSFGFCSFSTLKNDGFPIIEQSSSNSSSTSSVLCTIACASNLLAKVKAGKVGNTKRIAFVDTDLEHTRGIHPSELLRTKIEQNRGLACWCAFVELPCAAKIWDTGTVPFSTNRNPEIGFGLINRSTSTAGTLELIRFWMVWHERPAIQRNLKACWDASHLLTRPSCGCPTRRLRWQNS